jgi:hypothetical protein
MTGNFVRLGRHDDHQWGAIWYICTSGKHTMYLLDLLVVADVSQARPANFTFFDYLGEPKCHNVFV